MMKDDEKQLNQDEYRPLREVVFLTLRRQILKGELKPGERLMEITLANRLGVSRTPVREAIRKLEQDGLVEMLPRRGARVADITRQELSDVLEIRKSLELLAVSRSCENMTDDELSALRDAERCFAERICREDTDLVDLAESDEYFHDLIYASTKNRRLVQTLSQLREQMYRFRLECLKDVEVRQNLVAEHEGILKALEQRNREDAVRLTSLHIDNQYSTILKTLGAREENCRR